jgi:hypothetical protein
MKGWATIGAFLSLLAGGQPPMDPAAPRSERPAGYSIEGGDFYVWEEDQEEAERWAIELARSRPPVRD